ncbi:MAG: aminodeoxychorismate lyase [Gammaproteobacteria bacterium]|jgi:4-amino-4-deoxychorismate lyase|nr:aminodeoxychorismate lyase [Gammaproteobacteria bacterium]
MQNPTINHIMVNGIACRHISVMDRGLHYGDGLFETIACVDEKLQFWDEHIERMHQGAGKLGIATAAIDYFKDDVLALLKAHRITDCTIKLMLTRGVSERGYLSPSPQKVSRIVLLSALPNYPDEYFTQGISSCFCRHPLSQNSALAGIKHLNRLDNVLARNEWQVEYQEGFMLDDADHVIEGTMSNLFAVKNRELFTPALSHSGVNGIIRQQILAIAQAQNIETHIVDINKEQLQEMDEVFVCNSLIGIWPVNALANSRYKVGPLTRKIAQALQLRMHA